MPTPDPKVSSLALSIESVIGNFIPVFFLEYNGFDPKRAADLSDAAAVKNPDALEALSSLEPGIPLSQVILLAVLPLVINGIASLFLVPLSTAIGRRPVMLLAGFLAWLSGIWAGQSRSLTSYLAARSFQVFGAGVVIALVPLILQDMMLIHQRNKSIATLNASQGVILVCLRVAWFVTPALGNLRIQSNEVAQAGKEVYTLPPGEARPRLNVEAYGPRTKRTDFGILNTPMLWKQGFRAMLDTLKCFPFPTVLWAVLLTSIMAGDDVAAAILLTAGWEFEHLGLAGLAAVVATPFIWLFGGYLADKVSNHIAERRDGRREPENHLLNIIVPNIINMAGALVFGYAVANISNLSSAVVLVGVFFLVFDSSVLVTLYSLRLVIGFSFSVKATNWIQAIGFIPVFGIYAGLMAFAALLGILVSFYGKRIRVWTAGTI
ncbi:putative Major facilitator superfamily (MFS) profile domain-containing protein [Seiridium cardinale]|uniref:Major facilitator superfamily (MFS) profile domain-containing protein n=1 Tax=Seiridium cardinale TaxID=138064 RepID=A0ABR2Y5V6_9PEZI